jgi:hypothetical protein
MAEQRGVQVERFLVDDIEDRVNTRPNGKKLPEPIKLEECKLMRLVQYKCHTLQDPSTSRQYVECKPFERLFRQ